MKRKKKLMRGLKPVHAGLALVVGLTGGCIAKKKQEAGEGIARLTVRNLGSVVGLLNADTNCGFSSSLATSEVTDGTGEPGTNGTLVLTVTGCTVDAGAAPGAVATDCSGDTKTSSGSFTADATLTLTGLFTGDAASPIVPATADSVEFNLTKISFNEFKVVDSTSTDILTNRSGSISAKIAPRFAVAESGACAIATPNVTFTDITYSTDSVIFVDTADKDKEVEIGGSKFSAQNGTNADGSEQNSITGNMVVLGRDVPVDGLENEKFLGKLDPNFNAALFDEDFTCTPDLLLDAQSAPSFQCADVRQLVAENSGRLSALTLGIAAGVARANCPFVPAALTGGVGEDGSVLTLALAADCNLGPFPDGTVVSTDCNGETISISGSFTAKAGSTLEVTGYNVGNAAVGVLPTSRAPALITATLDFTDFSISKSVADPAVPAAVFTINSGTLSGEVAPRFFLDTTSGACTVSSNILGTAPVAFNNVTWTDGSITLDSDDLVDDNVLFNYTLNDSAINAQSGDNDAVVNEINGSITFSGAALTIAPGTPLQEDFDLQVFNDAFLGCADPNDNGIPATAIPVADAACSFRQVLGQTAARLLTGATATAVGTSNAFCFAAPTVTDNGNGSVTLAQTVANCAVDSNNIPGGNDVVSFDACGPDATGASTAATPTFVVTADGVLSTSGDFVGVAINVGGGLFAPAAPNAFNFNDMSIAMTNWGFEKSLANGNLAIGNSLARIVANGTVGVTSLTPIFAGTQINANIFPNKTPIALIDGLTMANGTATLILNLADPTLAESLATFNIDITNLDLDVVLGAVAGADPNSISGSLIVDGEPVTIAASSDFDAGFSQEALDDSYACIPGVILVAP